VNTQENRSEGSGGRAIHVRAGTVRTVLHVGCGPANPAKLHPVFRGPRWKEVRLDLNPAVKPDVVASITDMAPVADASVDAVWSSHNIEHLYAHEVPLALAEFRRVVKPGGFVVITTPDLQAVARLIAEDRLDEPAYTAPAGPITPLDILFGFGRSLAQGNHYMAHRTGFTATTLRRALEEAGFQNIMVKPDSSYSLWARATVPEVAEGAADGWESVPGGGVSMPGAAG